ncbi:MAG TPA: Gfo/Idh/MocA family oxidoreductase [Bacteroides sp.]|nr:Gfo/Idh/MocA family oxidoreductase [Bacteroides sp.]
MRRREFIATTGLAMAGSVLSHPAMALTRKRNKRRIALVGTGIRGVTFWGKKLHQEYGDVIEFVGLSDINPGRLSYALQYIGINCPTFVNFDEMMMATRPDLLIVTTVDSTHHQFIIKGLEYGVDVLTEKPLTTDEVKCQEILNAERRTGKKVIVGFNYRYGTLPTRIKELLTANEVGKITSVDFHWYLNTYHGASYFRRWHGLREMGGTLLVHKATHHFDLLNWLLNSEPEEVHAYGSLEHYGSNNPFRGVNCRNCAYTDKCKFYWDITKDQRMMDLYVKNEQYDGYIRDNCLWRHEIDIYDKMAVQIKYANNVQVSYSLATYAPYEGWRIAFNGMNGRLESWLDIPWLSQGTIRQSGLHAAEMEQSLPEALEDQHDIVVMKNWHDYKVYKVNKTRAGHGGGDKRLQDRIFRDPDMPDPLHHAAGTRDGAMSILVGIAARKSIEEKRVVRIEELTDLIPRPVKNS